MQSASRVAAGLMFGARAARQPKSFAAPAARAAGSSSASSQGLQSRTMDAAKSGSTAAAEVRSTVSSWQSELLRSQATAPFNLGVQETLFDPSATNKMHWPAWKRSPWVQPGTDMRLLSLIDAQTSDLQCKKDKDVQVVIPEIDAGSSSAPPCAVSFDPLDKSVNGLNLAHVDYWSVYKDKLQVVY
eukprot:TRINITY_DN966_c2_g2_i1.p1 TRINITY_DN966_c2_g2~~TRINITY_DN966_c2_g2_i1.p1  ORF type:complete len:186 (-),score=45.05 TRINITY_DN966_c2_g2_i1:405-962(-)